MGGCPGLSSARHECRGTLGPVQAARLIVKALLGLGARKFYVASAGATKALLAVLEEECDVPLGDHHDLNVRAPGTAKAGVMVLLLPLAPEQRVLCAFPQPCCTVCRVQVKDWLGRAVRVHVLYLRNIGPVIVLGVPHL